MSGSLKPPTKGSGNFSKTMTIRNITTKTSVFHGIFLSLSENILLEQTLIPLRRRLYDFPRRQYSYEWESMNLYTHQRFIDSVKLGNREAAVSIFRIEHWSYEVHKKYFKLYYDFDQKK